MEKASLIASLKEKAGVDNLSERTYEEIATAALPLFADDTAITDDTWKPFVQTLKSMSGQLRHDIADGILSGKSQWEADAKTAQEKAVADALDAYKVELAKQAEGDKTKKAAKEEKQSVSAEDITAQVLNSLNGENGAITEVKNLLTGFIAQMNQEKKDALLTKTRNALRDYLIDERMADREPVVNLAIKEMEIGDNPDLDKLKIEVEKKYEELYKQFYGDMQGGPYAGGTGGGRDTVSEFQKFINERKASAAKEAEDAQELKKLMM